MTAAAAPAGREGAAVLRAACACGKPVSARVELAGKSVRCPACKGTLRMPTRAEAAEPIADPASAGPGSCPICLAPLTDGPAAVRCPACRLPFHGECWKENGGCGAFGCALAPETVKEEIEGPVQTSWGDTKRCPRCREVIQAVAIKCRHCKADLGTRDSISASEWRDREERKKAEGSRRVVAVVSFLLSASCIGAPVGAGIALWHLRDPERRRLLEGADRFLFAASAILAALYAVALGLVKATDP